MRYPIRNIDAGAVPEIYRMNEGALPHVNSVPPDYFRTQIGNGSYFRAAYYQDSPVAFLLAMKETADYDSLNFLWFRDRYPAFVYIDRVVVNEAHRRGGLGGLLYRDLEHWAAGRAPLLACEVNLSPPNEASMRFHQRLGFRAVGTQETDGGRKTVSLMVMKLAPPGEA